MPFWTKFLVHTGSWAVMYVPKSFQNVQFVKRKFCVTKFIFLLIIVNKVVQLVFNVNCICMYKLKCKIFLQNASYFTRSLGKVFYTITLSSCDCLILSSDTFWNAWWCKNYDRWLVYFTLKMYIINCTICYYVS